MIPSTLRCASRMSSRVTTPRWYELRSVCPARLEEGFRVRTFSPRASDVERAWHVVDANGLVFGCIATEVARLLRGKHKPTVARAVYTGDHVCVVNAAKVRRVSFTADKK